MRYVKGKPKGCNECHKERERARPYNVERSRRYAAANRERINLTYRAWKAKNRLGKTGYRWGGEDAIAYAKMISGDPCVYCGEASGSIDHIRPVIRDGGGDWDNLAPVCVSCNCSKSDSEMLHFMLRRLGRQAA